MEVTICMFSGRKVATLLADPAWHLPDLLAAIPLSESVFWQLRVFWRGETELSGERTLADLGVVGATELMLVRSMRPCVLTASMDKTARLWCKDTGTCLRVFEGHEGGVTSAALSPDEEHGNVLTASMDGTVKLWCTAIGGCTRTLEGHARCVNSASFSHDGRTVLSASDDGTAKLWCSATGRCLHTCVGHASSVLSAVFFPDDKRIVTGSLDGTVKLWSVASAECLSTFAAGRYIRSIALAHDAKELLTAGDCVRLWSVGTGELMRTLPLRGVQSAVFSPDGMAVLFACAGNTASHFSVYLDECFRTFAGHRGGVCSAVFSADGSEVLTASNDGTVKLWSAADALCLRTFEGHGEKVLSAVFSC